MPFRERATRTAEVDDRPPAPPSPPGKTAYKAITVGIVAALLGWCGSLLLAASPEPDLQAPADDAGAFVSRVLSDIEEQWKVVLGERYRAPRLVLYTRNVATQGCGRASAAEGPFYCPDDERIYLDPSFFAELKTQACSKAGEDCEFARAYIVAHEFGHHVQKILGIMDRIEREGLLEGAGGLAVRAELQADCFAGVWAGRSSTKWKNVTPSMVAAGMEAAQFGGDDRFRIRPSQYSHGTSAQRGAWFRRGYDGKELASCDTFAGTP